MSNACTLGTYVDAGGFGGAAFVTRCACDNCTEREAKVQAEANARRKALLALDQAMTDLASGPPRPVGSWPEHVAVLTGQIANATEAWEAARPYVTGGAR